MKEEREHGDGREKLEIFQWKKCANRFFFLVLNASYLLKKMQAAPFPDPLPHCVLKEQKKRGGGGVVV